MEDGPVAELRDPENDYGLRVTAMIPAIKAMRVYAPWTDRLSRLSRSSIMTTLLGEVGEGRRYRNGGVGAGRVDGVEDPAGDIFAEFEPGGTSVKVRLGNA